MRHIIGSSESDVIIGSDKDQIRRCRKKDKDHMKFLCELYEAQVARSRYFVHELTSEVKLENEMRDEDHRHAGTRTTVADLCMFGLAACVTRVRQRERTDGHQRETSWNEDAKSMHRHASTRSCRREQHN